jgi:uncharacterized phage protein (TIGR02218 family)
LKPHVADYRWRIHALRIEAFSGEVVRFVEYPIDVVMGGETYSSGTGYQFTSYATTSSASPSVIDLEGILAAAGITRDQIVSGVWDGAKVYLFATTWADPIEDEEPLGKFILGKAQLRDDKYAVEMMHLVDALNQTVGRTITALCEWDFGSEECGVDLADYTVTGTITSVTDRGNFADSARAEAAGTFDGGTILFTTGDNAGLRALEVKRYSAGGALELFLPFHYLPQVGDTYTLTQGCPKTREACKSYDNILNFGGFPDQPTNNMVNKIGGQ